jgi:hypothetical protein
MKVVKHAEPDFVLEMTVDETDSLIEESKGLVIKQQGKNDHVITWLLVQNRWILICPPSSVEASNPCSDPMPH